MKENPYEERLNEINSHKDKNKKKNGNNKKNSNQIIINVAETQYSIVRTVAKKYKWNIINQPISSLNFDIAWIDGHCRQQIFARMQPYQKINHFPGMEILSRKNFLGRSLMEFKTKFPQQYDFFPLTWNLPTQFTDLKEYHDNRQEGRAQTFIVKPEAGCQGRGIFLTRNIEKLKYEKCVVQRYMHKPLLIDGLKFDLRIYVLITGVDPLRIFVYHQGLARFCTEKYENPKADNLENKFMHLTNYAINKLSPDFVFNEDAKQCNTGHKRSLSSIYKTFDELGYNSEQIKQRINDIIIKTIITGYPNLSRMQQSSHPENYANDMCFQILGFDVILNHQFNPFILEINYTPSFNIDTPFDKEVKKNLIYDTIKLLNINDKWKKEVRKKREAQVRQRMLSGKRVKLTLQEKNQLIQKAAKLRDEHEAKNLGGYTKIFCKSEDQMLKYARYYEFAQFLYQKENKLLGIATSKKYVPFYMPFIKSPKSMERTQFSRTGGLSSAKFISRPILTRQQGRNTKSIQNRKIISAKSIGSHLEKTLGPIKNRKDQQNIENDSKKVQFKNNQVFVGLNKQKQQISKKFSKSPIKVVQDLDSNDQSENNQEDGQSQSQYSQSNSDDDKSLINGDEDNLNDKISI